MMIPNLYLKNGWKSPNVHEINWLFGVVGSSDIKLVVWIGGMEVARPLVPSGTNHFVTVDNLFVTLW